MHVRRLDLTILGRRLLQHNDVISKASACRWQHAHVKLFVSRLQQCWTRGMRQCKVGMCFASLIDAHAFAYSGAAVVFL
jgi:hypothetical protein